MTEPAGHGLETRIRAPREMSAAERRELYQLMLDHYEHVERNDFERDLCEKQWVICSSAAGKILGFTTLMRLHAQWGGERLTALYSGDTVLDPTIWGSGGWTRAWGRLAATLMSEMNGEPLYWLLLTATHRTYRFLPTFLQEFYPRPAMETPAAFQGRMQALAQAKFGSSYLASQGIVRTDRPLRVRAERREMAQEGLADKHAAFFAERNPGYLQGDYLVCIGDLSFPNQTRLGHKFFSIEQTEGH